MLSLAVLLRLPVEVEASTGAPAIVLEDKAVGVTVPEAAAPAFIAVLSVDVPALPSFDAPLPLSLSLVDHLGVTIMKTRQITPSSPTTFTPPIFMILVATFFNNNDYRATGAIFCI